MSADELVIQEVRFVRRAEVIQQGDRLVGVAENWWEIDLQYPDGSVRMRDFPASIFEWRVAEYGFDPDDVETLLDVVLHEEDIAPVEEPSQHVVLTRWTPDKGAVEEASAPRRAAPVTLHSADTMQQAREAHLARIAEAKTRVKVVSPATKTAVRSKTKAAVPDPLDHIRSNMHVSQAGVEEKRVDVAQGRAFHAMRSEMLARLQSVPSAGAEDGTPT